MREAQSNACRLRLQARQQIARALHRQALVIEAKPQPAELPARPGAAGSAVIALRHDDAMAGMRGRNRGIDGEDASMAGADLAHHPHQKVLVLGVD